MRNEELEMRNEKKKALKYLPFLLLTFHFSLFICSCPDPFNANFDDSPADNLSPGMGSFTLMLSGASRTLVPTAPSLGALKYLELIFTTSGVGANKTVQIDNYNGASSLDAVELLPGTYSLTIDAYIGPGKTNLAARGMLAGIVINAGQPASGSVTLKALLTEGTGTFSWNVAPTSMTITTAKTTITPLTAGGTAEEVILTSDSPMSGTRTLISGVYNVTFYLETSNKSLEWTELVYIYSSLETVFNNPFTDDYFNNLKHTVTFVFNNGEGNGTQTVLHGGFISEPQENPTKAYTPEAGLFFSVVPAQYSFSCWMNNGTPWDFDDNRVYGDMTLTADYIVPGLISYNEVPPNDIAAAITFVNNYGYEYILLVGEDVNIDAQNVTLSAGTLTITSIDPLSPRTITRGVLDTTDSSGLFIVNNGAKLVFENIIVDGKKADFSANRASLVRVESGGEFTMNTGAVLQNNRAANGGGVYVIGGNFTLDGGEIKSCEVPPPGSSAGTGNGVYINGGTFTMNKGDISGNTGDFSVFIASDAAFEMKDGSISGNNQSNTNGVNVVNGEFIMRGGTIKDNSSLAVRASYPESSFTMYGGEIKNNGSGVIVGNSGGGTFIMNGGEIFDNTHSYTSSSPYGAGVQIYSGGTSFTAGGTAKIYGNKFVNTTSNVQSSSNVFLPGGKYIILGTGANAPEDGMEIWVQTDTAGGIIVDGGANTAHVGYFHADDDDKAVVLENDDQLVIVDKSTLPDFYTQVADYGSAADDVTIYLYDDLTLNTTVSVPANAAGKTLTIKSANASNPCTLLRNFGDTAANSGLFVVSSGAKLVFEDIIIDGKKATYTSNTASLVRVNGGTLTLGSGAVLKNNRTIYSGGGVEVNSGTFTMNGGTISDNAADFGGGVFLSGGTFTMNDSDANVPKISGNTAFNGGGGVNVNGGTFNMNGGTISGNVGGGVCTVVSSTFRISNGTVYGSNEAALSNTASEGAALFNGGTAQYGTFSGTGGAWVSKGNLSTTDDTIIVIDGVLFDAIFTDTADLNVWLNIPDPSNSPSNPYTIKLNVGELGDCYTPGSIASAIGDALFTSGKYVILDFSDSTFTSIGEYVFGDDCNYLTGIIIPNTVTTISDYAFSGTGITGITIPNSVTSIGLGAFQGTGITTINIPASVTEISSGAFAGCADLTGITIDAGNNHYEFYNNMLYNKARTNLIWAPHTTSGHVDIPEGVTEIGYNMFSGTGITGITIPNTVTSIGIAAFANCNGLTDSLAIPSSVTSIGGMAFFGCTGLTGITISDGVTSIGESAFRNCSGITSITIPASVTSIGPQAFTGYAGLTSVIFATGSNITSENLGDIYNPPFPGDLKDKYLAPGGGAGTYTRAVNGTVWTKQP